ncbi:MAG TPA: 30S ribosomal protein S16 [Candidatus Paceibacterota bacterium]
MLTIRLQRIGKKHDPSYRVALIDSRKAPKSGAFLEHLGSYNPQRGKPQLKAERIKEWMGKGAQASETVHNILVREKLIAAKKKDVLHHTRIAKAKEKKGSGKSVEAA